MIRSLASAAALAVTLAASSAVAARAPTIAEREAITRALPVILRNAPVECLWLRIRISRSKRYALVAPEPLNWRSPGSRCARYASNGFYVLRKSARWRIVYDGSDPPRCSMHVPRDLVRCLP